MRRAVFLDRDGTLNQSITHEGRPHSPLSLDEFALYADVPDAVARLRAAGFVLVLVTNQPDVARGRIARETVEAMHRELRSRLLIDSFKVCYELETRAPDRYKPAPGMLREAARELDLDLAASYLIGDRWRDIGAGRAAGCRTVFIDRGYREARPEAQDWTVFSFGEAVETILAEESTLGGKAEPADHDSLGRLKIQIFADGADLAGIAEMYGKPYIKGFTTNPTLMRRAGITDYKAFALDVLKIVPDRPVSFEVFADEFDAMEMQALEIASWGANVYVKIPVMNTKGQSAAELTSRLSAAGVKLNVTAILTLDQVRTITEALAVRAPAILSVFAGRIADTGRDPIPLMGEALSVMKVRPQAQLLWASPREILNIFQAEAVGCHIITVTNDALNKLSLLNKDLARYSLETVEMFYKDAKAAGYTIDASQRAAE